jgi:hypothetical protein
VRSTILVAAVVCAATSSVADEMRYTNARFGTSIAFPAEIFSEAMEPPANGDGMTWRSADGASLAVFGQHNALEMSPTDLVAEASQPGVSITYSRSGKDWAVVSGTEGRLIFYQRFEFGADDVIHSVLLRYPAALKATYDPLVGPVVATLDGP